MNGTSFSHTRAIDRTPPRITEAVITVIIAPVIQGERFKVSFINPEIELACTMLPIPNAATAVKNANTTASHLFFIPRSITYIGPPDIWPL